jgi:hypothetical protein
MAVGTFWLATDTALPAVFPVSVAALAWPRVTVPRASPPRRPAVRSPLHFVCVLLARPMFRETRLPGPFFLVHPIVSRTPADCGPACWARTHRATAHATLLLRECSSRCCGSRPSPHPLVSAYSAPPACYHGSRLSGDLGRVTLHVTALLLCGLPGGRSIKQRSAPQSSCPYREVGSLGPICPCIPLPRCSHVRSPLGFLSGAVFLGAGRLNNSHYHMSGRCRTAATWDCDSAQMN